MGSEFTIIYDQQLRMIELLMKEEITTFFEMCIVDGSGSNMNPKSNLTQIQLVNTFHLRMDVHERTFTDDKQSDSVNIHMQILASKRIQLV